MESQRVGVIFNEMKSPSAHPFLTFIRTYQPISDATWQEIEADLQRIPFAPQEIILAEGQICQHLYFLESGLLRWFILREGEEVTKYFTEAPYAFTSQQSFTMALPAEETIQTLAPSVVWRLPKETTFCLLTHFDWSEFVRKLVQEVQRATQDLMIELQTLTAEQRYRDMLERGDPLLAQVPLKYLASYLGIAPRSLSRIRNRIMKEGSFDMGPG